VAADGPPATVRGHNATVHIAAQLVGSPFVDLDREAWSRLGTARQTPLTEDELVRLRGLGDRLDLKEVEEVYLPLSRLLSLYVDGVARLHEATSTFLGEAPERTPFVIGVAGSVAVGKSTTASWPPCSPAGPTRRRSTSSPPTASCCPMPSWPGAD